jgi:outer membrane lipoprotein
MHFRTALTLLVLLLAGCATQPTPLQGEFTPTTPDDATTGDRTGAMVRWGGRIVRTEPLANRTCFEVLSTRLDRYARPYWATDDVGSRFIACRTGFFDPALFQPNREVTFTGLIDGYENRRIGQYDYRFPRLAADVIYLWPIRQPEVVMPYGSPWPWWGSWGW